MNIFSILYFSFHFSSWTAIAQESEDESSKKDLENQLPQARAAVLQQHNLLRKRHGVPPFVSDPKLDEMAQAWADTLIKTKKFEHSSFQEAQRLQITENIGMGTGNNANVTKKSIDFVNHWYLAMCSKSYNFTNPPFAGDKFTQIVWKGTKKLGVGVGRDKKRLIVVAKYSPGGNIIGKKHMLENVLPPKEEKLEDICKGQGGKYDLTSKKNKKP